MDLPLFPAPAASFWRAWRWWLPPALIALALVLYFVDPFIGDWDGMDYTMLSLDGYPSSMALGRNLFIFTNHALFRVAHALFGVQPRAGVSDLQVCCGRAGSGGGCCVLDPRSRHQWLTLHGDDCGAADCLLASLCSLRRTGDD